MEPHKLPNPTPHLHVLDALHRDGALRAEALGVQPGVGARNGVFACSACDCLLLVHMAAVRVLRHLHLTLGRTPLSSVAHQKGVWWPKNMWHSRIPHAQMSASTALYVCVG